MAFVGLVEAYFHSKTLIWRSQLSFNSQTENAQQSLRSLAISMNPLDIAMAYGGQAAVVGAGLPPGLESAHARGHQRGGFPDAAPEGAK